MSKISVVTGTIKTYQGGLSNLKLRIYVSKTFMPSTVDDDPPVIVEGSPIKSLSFYREVACSVVDGIVTYETFQLDCTVDAIANCNDTSYAILLYDTDDNFLMVVEKFLRVPRSTPTTLGAIKLFSQLDDDDLPNQYYTSEETDGAIAQALTALTFGVVHSDDAIWLALVAHGFVHGDSAQWTAIGLTLYLESFSNNLATAVDTIGSTPCRLVYSQATTLSVDKTTPSTMRLVRRGVGNITVAAGKTLTIGSFEDPGSVRCFTLANSSTSHLRFSSGAVAEFNTAWVTGPGGGDITVAAREAIASCSAAGRGSIYTPEGTWTSPTAAFDIPAYTNWRGDGKNRTFFQNNSNTYWFRFIENIRFNTFEHFQINGALGQAQTNSALRWYGPTGASAGFQAFKSVGINGNHIGCEVLDSGGVYGFQVANVSFDHDCEKLGNDFHWWTDTQNMDIEENSFLQSNWQRTGGDYTTPVGYSQYIGKFLHSGRPKFTRECAGLSAAYNPGGGSVFNGYGNNQVQQIIISNSDNVTVGGTALVTVRNVNMYGDSGVGTNRVVEVPFDTSHNTGAKIAAQLRQCLADDPNVGSCHHAAYGRDTGTSTREVNLIYLDPAATDTTGAFSINPNGVTGLSTYASSTRLPGKSNFLPEGFWFLGSHTPAVFETVDEGFNSFIINDADDEDSSILLSCATVQSPIRLNKTTTLGIAAGCSIVDRTVRDGGSDGSTYFGTPKVVNNGAVIPSVSNFWLSTGASEQVLSGRRVSNFGTDGNNRWNGVVGLDVDNPNMEVRTEYKTRTYRTVDSSTTDNDPIATFGNANNVDQTKPIVGFGTTNNRGKLLYGYTNTRVIAGSGFPTDFLGFLKWIGTQSSPYAGWQMLFPMVALGMLSNSPTQTSGYFTGAGSAVTQSTNKGTTVALNTPSGQITMNNAALAANTIVPFIVINSSISLDDTIEVTHKSGGTSGAYRPWAHTVCPTQTSGALIVGHIYKIVTFVAGDNFGNVGTTGTGATGTIFTASGTTPTTYSNGSTLMDLSFKISVENVTGGSLSEAVKLQINIHRGAIS